MENKNTVGHLVALLTIFIWGTTFISTKILLNDFTPIEILFIRFIMGLIALMVVYPHRMKVKDKKHELLFMGAGLCGVTLYYLLENIALTFTMASNVGVICSLAPFFTAILTYLFLKDEPLRINFFIGFVVSMVGICLISFSGTSNFQLNPLGDLLAVGATIVWALYSVLTRKISNYGYNTIQITRRFFFYGTLFMIPSLFLFEFKLGLERFADPVNLFNIVFLGLGASALCFVTWNFAVKVLGAIKTSIYIYMIPVITVVTSILVLHEKITSMAAIGTVLTLAGLFVSESKIFLKKKASKQKHNDHAKKAAQV
ncbi:DMT family transporter [Schinkia azotoformans]|uniref:DMT family transporter n=1 Tax=Schinkia azotoformans TaxID=1454 RepID=UPI002DBA3494|nr:DMT family transporter [Schinkia azotoformans]MEC1698165.1 DMT family transporter [Schinkia azotoformans]MEC1726982.1 DMT family transporter [Schinkia azotoformans]MEC1773917.1 DMT family transporter [Schinkia azotoformans]MEC1782277.1 DMT family transporter [Schinkia azotoformans]MED4330167.1 DMT family transporter [Schinkia azotoformans]